MVRYALAPEDKEARRDAILAAARTLFLADGGSLPSAARIADAAGLAKGTVYLYFRTKEEIFAALLIAEWRALLDEVVAAFAPGGGSVDDTVAAFLDRYVGHFDQRPELLRLDALGYAVLEKNLGTDELRAFKLAFVERLNAAGAVVERRLGLPGGRGLQLLMRTYALTRGLWQALDYPEHLTALMDEPALAPMRPAFREELADALAEYWRGALAPTRDRGRDLRPHGRGSRGGDVGP